jgi:hypothetical protein
MRGKPQAQPDFLTVLNLNATVPTHHPLRAIKRQVDAVFQKLSSLFEELYEPGGRPSIPPEQLVKARLLTALYSVRSERLCSGGHLLMENRNGLCADFRIHDPIAEPGPRGRWNKSKRIHSSTWAGGSGRWALTRCIIGTMSCGAVGREASRPVWRASRG